MASVDGVDLTGRRCRLTIATPVSTPGDFSNITTQELEINGAGDPATPGMRVQFKVAKSTGKEPNTAEITVTNLSPGSRALLQTKGSKLVLEAGYEKSGLSVIFKGDIRVADPLREKAEWNTKMKCGDGDRAFRYARASESFGAGAAASDVLRYLAGQMGIPLGNVPQKVADFTQRFDSGYVVMGAAQRELDRLVKSLGYTWSIQDEALQVLAPGEAVQTLIPLISPTSGLVGSPEMGSPEKRGKGKPQLVKFKSLLLAIQCGGLVHLQSKRYDGQVLVKKFEHDGDVRGNDWYTTIEGVLHAGS